VLAHTTPEDFIRSVDQAKLERRRQRDAEMALDTRPLQPWERYRALVDQKGCGHRKESRSKASGSRINHTVSKVIGFGKCHRPLV